MWIGWSFGHFLCRRYERGNFNLDLGTDIDETFDVEQRRGREISSERLAPGRANTGAGGFIFAAAGPIPVFFRFRSLATPCNPPPYHPEVIAFYLAYAILALRTIAPNCTDFVATALPPNWKLSQLSFYQLQRMGR